MIEFHSNRTVKATRKPHQCEQCGRTIEVGSAAVYSSGKYDDLIYTNYSHSECEAAALAYAKLNDLWDEEWPWFQHMDDCDHHGWLLENHPVVAERLNIKREPVEA